MEITFTGGQCLTHEGWDDAPVAIAEGRFVADRAGRTVDTSGFWLLPGIVDVHGDGFERHVAPRRGLVLDMAPAIAAIEVELASCGVTTAWLAQFWSWEGGMRGPQFAQDLSRAVRAARPVTRVDLRVQLRLETHMTGDADAVLALIDGTGIDYLVFNDHLPHDRLRAGQTPPRLNGQAAKARRSPADHLAIMQGLEAQSHAVPGFLDEMASACAARGVRLGSHDDGTGETRARYATLGARISEFPTTRDAAEAARAQQGAVVMGAPNVVRGGSHNRGGIAAETLVADGLVDALASDYHYPSLIGAVFALQDRGICPVEQGWHLVSSGPAKMLGLTDRGRIAPGARADLTVIDPATRQVGGCFAGGRPVWLSGTLAERMLGQ